MSEKVYKYGRATVAAGSITDEKEFVKLIVSAGYHGNTKQAWREYKKSLPAKKKTASKPKKEESVKEK